jgi:predicted AAA+ superfamily ATPase
MNYIKYLKDARLLNLLYTDDKQFPQKPQKIYLQNTNLIYSNPHRQVSAQIVAETFFYNALHALHKVNASNRNAMFFIDNKYYFDVLDRMPNKQPIRLTALAGCENTDDKLIIPLWLFGFLY